MFNDDSSTKTKILEKILAMLQEMPDQEEPALEVPAEGAEMGLELKDKAAY